MAAFSEKSNCNSDIRGWRESQENRAGTIHVREAYNKFEEENPSLKFGLTRFYELGPTHVKLLDQIPHHHENVRLLLVALKEHTSLNSDFSAFIEQVTCDASSKECMSGKCYESANAIEKYAPANKSYPIHYQQWQMSTIGSRKST